MLTPKTQDTQDHWWQMLDASSVLAAAIVITLVMYIPNRLELMPWLERLSMMAVTKLSMVESDTPLPAPPGKAPPPRVLLIDDAYFEKNLGLRSPLDRGVMAKLVQDIAARGPRSLSIDFDLSPGLADGNNPAQQRLDAALVTLGRQTPVVLLFPFALTDPAATLRNHAWMRKLCSQAPRLDFALGTVIEAQGTVMRFDPLAPILGGVTQRNLAVSGQRSGLCGEILAYDDGSLPLLDKMQEAHMQRQFIAKKRLTPINPAVFEHRNAIRHALSAELPATFQGEAIFLGGSYGLDDRYLTVAGELPGVMVHAASYHSLWAPVDEVFKPLLMAMQFIFVVFAIAGFSLLKVWEDKSLKAAKAAKAEKHQWMPTLIPLRTALITLLVAACLASLTLAISTELMAQATWFNPAATLAFCVIAARRGYRYKTKIDREFELDLKDAMLDRACQHLAARGPLAPDGWRTQLQEEGAEANKHAKDGTPDSFALAMLNRVAPNLVSSIQTKHAWIIPLATPVLGSLAAVLLTSLI